MDSPDKDVVGMKEGAKGESVSETGDLAGMTNQAVREFRSASFLPVNPWMLKHDAVQGHEGVQARQVGGQTSRSTWIYFLERLLWSHSAFCH